MPIPFQATSLIKYTYVDLMCVPVLKEEELRVACTPCRKNLRLSIVSDIYCVRLMLRWPGLLILLLIGGYAIVRTSLTPL